MLSISANIEASITIPEMGVSTGGGVGGASSSGGAAGGAETSTSGDNGSGAASESGAHKITYRSCITTNAASLASVNSPGLSAAGGLFQFSPVVESLLNSLASCGRLPQLQITKTPTATGAQQLEEVVRVSLEEVVKENADKEKQQQQQQASSSSDFLQVGQNLN